MANIWRTLTYLGNILRRVWVWESVLELVRYSYSATWSHHMITIITCLRIFHWSKFGIASYLWQDGHFLPHNHFWPFGSSKFWNFVTRSSFYIIPCDPKEVQSFGLNRSSNFWLVDESEQKMLVFDWSCLSQAITRMKNSVFVSQSE